MPRLFAVGIGILALRNFYFISQLLIYMLDFRLNNNLYSRAIFLDRDGTINHDKGYTHRCEELVFMEGVIKGLKLLSTMPIHIIIVTNQSGIALGIYEYTDMRKFHEHMVNNLRDQGVRIDAIYFAPYFDLESKVSKHELHYETKPNPGMLTEAASDFIIDINSSWMVGDKLTDIVAGKRAGAKTILIQNDKHKQYNLISKEEKPHFIVSDFLEAAKQITKEVQYLLD